MKGVKAVLLLGIACFAAYASAQDLSTAIEAALAAAGPAATPETSALLAAAGPAAAPAESFEQVLAAAPQAGTYIVNGTGVVYDSDTVIFYLNGSAVATVPNPHADGPTPYDPHKDGHKDDDKKYDDKKDDDMKDDDDKKLPLLDLPKPDSKKKDPPTPSPDAQAEESQNIFQDIGVEHINPNPLYNVIVGRKLMH